MNRTIFIPLFICILAIGIFVWIGQVISSLWLFIPLTIITFILYLFSFYKRMPPANRILHLYLLAMAVQMLHFAEEYLTGFVVELPALFGQDPYPKDYWLVFNMAAYSIFLLGGIVLLRQLKELAVIPLFFIVVGVLFNTLAHIGISLYTGAYFPGLYTCALYLLLAPLLIKRIFSTS